MESVLAQAFPGALELLVGDDGSADGTREIIAELAARDPRVKPFFHSPRLGPAGNLHALVAAAQGELIAHLDGDDFWMPGKLAEQMALLDERPELTAACCNAVVIGPQDEPLGLFNGQVPVRIGLRELLHRGNFLNHSSLLYRASAKSAVLGMDAPFIDYRVHVRLSKFGALGYLNQALVGHRWRTPGSMIRTEPVGVYSGHLDAFREAADIGAAAADLRGAIGRFWGKLLVRSIIARRWGDIFRWGRTLLRKRELGYGIVNLMIDSLRAGPWAMRSWWRRRHGERVYFPSSLHGADGGRLRRHHS